MQSLLLLALVLAVLDVAWASSVLPNSLARRRSEGVRELVRRQIVQNSTVSNTTSSSIVPITLSDDKQTYYIVQSLGNISFRLALDTGSSDLWLVDSACATNACKSLPKYPLNFGSPSFVSVNNNASVFNLSFADNTWASGFAAKETVQLANLSLPNQAIGLVNSTTVLFTDQVSGILGLGFPRLSKINSLATNGTPFFANLAEQGHLDYPMFGMSLSRNSTGGSLAFGALDSTVVRNASMIAWSEVVPFRPFLGSSDNTSSYLQWAIPLSNIAIGSTVVPPQPTYPYANSNNSIALLDVGLSGILGPYQDVLRIFSSIPESRLVDPSGQWAIPCDTNDTMTFTFGSQNFTLLPSDYLIGPVADDSNICWTWPQAAPPSSDGIDWQIGSAFLRTVYSIFSYGITDKEAPMIGLYPLTPSFPAPAALPLASLSAIFSSLSLTVSANLPNTLVPTPSFTTPPYTFNTSVPTTAISAQLGNATYRPLLNDVNRAGDNRFNFTALPQVSPSPSFATVVMTAANGAVITTTSPLPTTSVTLGQPPGWTNGAVSLGTPRTLAYVSALACIWRGLALFL